MESFWEDRNTTCLWRHHQQVFRLSQFLAFVCEQNLMWNPPQANSFWSFLPFSLPFLTSCLSLPPPLVSRSLSLSLRCRSVSSPPRRTSGRQVRGQSCGGSAFCHAFSWEPDGPDWWLKTRTRTRTRTWFLWTDSTCPLRWVRAGVPPRGTILAVFSFLAVMEYLWLLSASFLNFLSPHFSWLNTRFTV